MFNVAPHCRTAPLKPSLSNTAYTCARYMIALEANGRGTTNSAFRIDTVDGTKATMKKDFPTHTSMVLDQITGDLYVHSGTCRSTGCTAIPIDKFRRVGSTVLAAPARIMPGSSIKLDAGVFTGWVELTPAAGRWLFCAGEQPQRSARR